MLLTLVELLVVDVPVLVEHAALFEARHGTVVEEEDKTRASWVSVYFL